MYIWIIITATTMALLLWVLLRWWCGKRSAVTFYDTDDAKPAVIPETTTVSFSTVDSDGNEIHLLRVVSSDMDTPTMSKAYARHLHTLDGKDESTAQ